MDIYISINGVLRNLIQKFDYHYEVEFLDSDIIIEDEDETPPFEYGISPTVYNDNLLDYYEFQSVDEYNNFLFVDFALEIFGHSGVSYMSVMSDLNKMIYDNPHINFTIVGLDEYGKAKSSTLFFLSKYGYLGDNIRFIKSENICKEWKKCDMWVTDHQEIIDKCPINKVAVKFVTEYNNYFTHKNEIQKLSECLKLWEKGTTSTWINSLMNVVMLLKNRKKRKRKMKKSMTKNLSLK